MIQSPDTARDLIKSVLQEDYIEVSVAAIAIEDDMHGGCEVGLSVGEMFLEGGGVGAVDAIFQALKNHYALEYESLNSIELSDFKVTLTGKRARRAQSGVAGTDSYCECLLTLRNSYGSTFTFKAASCSLAAAVARVIALGVEHFVNAERAYIALQRALEDARRRNRQDLVTRYTSAMADVVRCTSYADILERISQEVI